MRAELDDPNISDERFQRLETGIRRLMADEAKARQQILADIDAGKIHAEPTGQGHESNRGFGIAGRAKFREDEQRDGPWNEMQARGSSMSPVEVRGAALRTVEVDPASDDDRKESVTRLVERLESRAAGYIAAVANPAYLRGRRSTATHCSAPSGSNGMRPTPWRWCVP